MKEAVKTTKYKDMIWEVAKFYIYAEYGFTEKTIEYIKTLLNKETLTDSELYELSLFTAWDVNYSNDFDSSKPAILILWDRSVPVQIDYWSIPRVIINEWQHHIKRHEPVYEGSDSTVEEDFANEPFDEPVDDRKVFVDKFIDSFDEAEKEFLAKQKNRPWIKMAEGFDKDGLTPEQVKEVMKLAMSLSKK